MVTAMVDTADMADRVMEAMADTVVMAITTTTTTI